MQFKTDTTVVHLIRIWIIVLVDNAQLIFISYCTNMLSSEDTNNMLNVSGPDKIQMCGPKPIQQSFTYSYFNISIGG
jgi:hypothetical protein